MPSAIPVGLPCIGIVMARLIVGNEDRGVRPFIVKLNNGIEMCEGVKAKSAFICNCICRTSLTDFVSRRVPPRDDSDPVNHSLTTFTHVRVPGTALLGTLSPPKSLRLQFLSSIWRVTVGSMVISFVAIPSLQLAAYTVAKYSLRRTVQGATPRPEPIISFRTQQAPIMTAMAESIVFQKLKERLVPVFLDSTVTVEVRRAFAAICKVVMLRHHQISLESLINRCGAQGVFRYNGLTSSYVST